MKLSIYSMKVCTRSFFCLLLLSTTTVGASDCPFPFDASQCRDKSTGQSCTASNPCCPNGGCASTCAEGPGFMKVGCGSCISRAGPNGITACRNSRNVQIGNNACRSDWIFAPCDNMYVVYVQNDSCVGDYACARANTASIGTKSCITNDDTETSPCIYLSNSAVGDGSCSGSNSCSYVSVSAIKNGSCNLKNACRDVISCTVDDGSCNGQSACQGNNKNKVSGGSCNAK